MDIENVRDKLRGVGLEMSLEKTSGTDTWTARIKAREGGLRGLLSSVSIEYSASSPEEAMKGVLEKLKSMVEVKRTGRHRY